MEEDLIITISDIRAVAFCLGGARAWAKTYGLSWSDFLRDGILASRLPKDALAERVIKTALERRGG